MDKSFSAYDTALIFSNTFKILFDKHMLARMTGNYEEFALVISAIANGAFACELFLKSLLTAPLRGHRLYNDLFCKLDPLTAQEIETLVIECFKRKKEKTISSEEFFSNFKNLERSFEEFRYFHEPKYGDKEKVYNLDFLEVLVFSLREICEKKFGVRPVREQ
ncbi:hypothetical protein AAK917_12390 [Oscillospiraceae bacterium 52-8]